MGCTRRITLAACLTAAAVAGAARTAHAYADVGGPIGPIARGINDEQLENLPAHHGLSQRLSEGMRVAAAAVPAAGTPNLTAYLLPDPAVCINGCPASVRAAVRDPNLWVITLGSLSAPGGAGWCLTPEACAWEANQPWNATDNKKADPFCFTTAPPPAPLSNGGLQSTDCDENPVFCEASHAMISGCDLGMWMGDGVAVYTGKNGDGNGTFNGSANNQPASWLPGSTTMHFKGQSILRESVTKLASLGMSRATHVLVTGFVWSGTGLVYHADTIGDLIKAAVPSLQVFKVLPVDAVHPKFMTMMCTTDVMEHACNSSSAVPPDCDEVAHMGPKCARIPNYDGHHYVGTWLDSSLPDLYNTTQHAGSHTGRLSTPPPPIKCNQNERCPSGTMCSKSGFCPADATGCVGAKCMWFNESAPHIKSDMFVVQAMPGVWDTHCAYEAGGVGIGPFPDLISCSAHGNYFFPQYQCAQYNDHCLKTIIQHWDVPLQQAYLNDVIASGHGGFVHSCFLGAYWNSPPYPNPVLAALPVSEGGTGNKTTMWWNQIRINGVSMRDAVHKWWNGTDTSKTVHKDCVWNGSSTGGPPWPGSGTPPGNPDGRMPWYTSKYNCNPTCWGNPFY